jgi:hypothetical protein
LGHIFAPLGQPFIYDLAWQSKGLQEMGLARQTTL